MNSRERFFVTMSHREPDRIPYMVMLLPKVMEGMNARLKEGVDYRDYYRDDIRLVSVDYPERKQFNLKENIFPMPKKEALEQARRDCDAVKERGLVACNAYVPGIFEHLKDFIGDQATLENMLLEPEDTKKLIGYITDYLCRLYERFAKAGFDICFNGDDIGTQRSTIMGMNRPG